MSQPSGTLVSAMVSDDELEVVLEAMRAGGFPAYSVVVRHGLWLVARQLDLALPPGAFGVSKRRQTTKDIVDSPLPPTETFSGPLTSHRLGANL